MKIFKPLFATLFLAVMALTFNSCKEKSQGVSILGTWATKQNPTTKIQEVISFETATTGRLWQENNGVSEDKMSFNYVLEATTLTVTAKDMVAISGKITTLNERELSVAVSSPRDTVLNFIKR